MPRNTLDWERCDLCGRKGATVRCTFGGRILNLCPYCALALSGKYGLECKELALVLPSTTRRLHVTEEALERIRIEVASRYSAKRAESETTHKTSTRRGGRQKTVSKRSYYRRKR